MTTTIEHSGFRFPEGSRWHQGQIWFSDMHTGEVMRILESGEPEVVTTIDDRPSGLAWLPDGSLLVSSMTRRHILRVRASGETSVYADLSGRTASPINDMVLDPVSEHLYVGGFGYDLWGDAPRAPGPLFDVAPDGTVLDAEYMVFPNGAVILPGTRTLVVAETWAARLTAFTIGTDGALRDKRIWAGLPEGATPDGIAVDAESGVWASDITHGRFLRILAGGLVTDTVAVGERCAIDCTLGGPDGRTLYLLTANSWQPEETEVREGRIETVRVAVPAVLDATGEPDQLGT